MTRFLAISSSTALLGHDFPHGTLIVNVIGSFIAGILIVLISDRDFFSAHVQSLLFIGFAGALTTFSTFSVDTITLIQQSEWIKAVINIFLNISLCLIATLLGIFLARGH